MRRLALIAGLLLVLAAPTALTSSLLRSYAQTPGAPQPWEFQYSASNNLGPFHMICGTTAPACPDTPAANTWSVNNTNAPGVLRIWTQYGTELGTVNNARNMAVQPVDPNQNWTVTTRMTFPATPSSSTALGQTAGMIAYQDDNNFIYVARTYPVGGTSQLWFVQEIGGVDLMGGPVTESNGFNTTIYLQLTKSGSFYQAAYSYDNVTYTALPTGPLPVATATPTSTATGTPTITPAPTSTNTPLPSGYTATFTSLQLGLFAWGGANTASQTNLLPADFAWFRTGNPLTPAPSPTATTTGTALATSTSTSTVVPTSTTTAVPTSTSTLVPTATSTATATATSTQTPVPPVPTDTPLPPAPALSFKSVSLWYHAVRPGTFNHLDVQGTPKRTLGIWVNVYWPNAKTTSFYTNTDGSGHWSQSFGVPGNAFNNNNHNAIVTLQLWKGKRTVKNFVPFVVVK